MTDGPPHPLDGDWRLARVSGLLPPLGLLHKRIDGGRGSTRLGSAVRLPFSVRSGPRGPELVYAGPLAFVRDRLVPGPGGGWAGRTYLWGVPVGRFRMVRARRWFSAPRDARPLAAGLTARGLRPSRVPGARETPVRG